MTTPGSGIAMNCDAMLLIQNAITLTRDRRGKAGPMVPPDVGPRTYSSSSPSRSATPPPVRWMP